MIKKWLPRVYRCIAFPFKLLFFIVVTFVSLICWIINDLDAFQYVNWKADWNWIKGAE